MTPPKSILAPCLLVTSLVAFLAMNVHAIREHPEDHVDFRIYSACAHAFATAPDAYADADFRGRCFYPPGWYALSSFVFEEPSPRTAVLWSSLVFACTLALFLAPVLLPHAPHADARTRSLALACWAPLLFLAPFTSSLGTANASALVALLVSAACIVLLRRTRGAAWWAGLAIGIAAVIKLHPLVIALFLPALAAKGRDRRWRDAGLVATGLFLSAQFLPHAQDFWHFTLSPAGLSQSLSDRGSNNSVAALMHRLGIEVSPAVVLAGLALPLAVWFVRRRLPERSELALLVLLPLAASPAVWPHTYTLAVLPLFVALEGVLDRWLRAASEHRSRRTRALLGLLGMGYCLLVLGQSEHFSLRGGLLSVFGLGLACAMPIVLAGLLVTTSSDRDPRAHGALARTS